MQTLTTTLCRLMARVAAVIIFLLPFHAFLTVWLSTGLGHYTALRLWKEVFLGVLVLGATGVSVCDARLRRRFWSDRLILIIVGYLLLIGIYAVVGYAEGKTAHKALAYGLLADSRFLFFFLVTFLVTMRDGFIVRWWRQLLLVPASGVVGFACLQHVALPHDFLRHFGYGPATIPATETVDQNQAYTRVQSTLRGANPLGAYLVVVMSALGMWLLRWRRRRWATTVYFLLAGLALYATFSRSAWLGTVVALGILLWLSLRSEKLRRLAQVTGAVFVLAGAVTGISLRHSTRFQNVFLHTSSQSRSSQSSNQGHAVALAGGVHDTLMHPFGGGLGTAGPASTYNNHPARIAENYYIQIGQELGWLGMGLFIAITGLVTWRLWQRRSSDLALLLFVSGVGLLIVNMLSHAWSDDTLVYIWWGLAGAALAQNSA